jgi:hypothetical protein
MLLGGRSLRKLPETPSSANVLTMALREAVLNAALKSMKMAYTGDPPERRLVSR